MVIPRIMAYYPKSPNDRAIKIRMNYRARGYGGRVGNFQLLEEQHQACYKSNNSQASCLNCLKNNKRITRPIIAQKRMTNQGVRWTIDGLQTDPQMATSSQLLSLLPSPSKVFLFQLCFESKFQVDSSRYGFFSHQVKTIPQV